MEYATTYSNGHGQYYAAVYLPWAQVEAILGHPHRGEPEDEERLVQWLRDQGAPAWVQDAEGWIDESGWGLIGPRLVGWEAIRWYQQHGGQLGKYADPTEGARDNLTVSEALEVAREDPSLIFYWPEGC
jgi:hypothetical protein